MLNSAAQDGGLAPAAERHLATIFGHVEPFRRWEAGLPYYLKDAYAFYEARVLGIACIFMAPRSAVPEAAVTLAKQRNAAENHADGAMVILLLSGLTQHDRRTLIGMGAPFLVPGNQFFAPQLGVDLRERIRAPNQLPGVHLTPSAQLVVLAALLGQDVQGANASQLGKRLHRSAMSMVRVFNELQGLELAEARSAGRERQIILFHAGRALWEKARPFLRTPVRRRREIAFMPPDLGSRWAGETALADFTLLSPPRHETWAIDAKLWFRVEAMLPKPPANWGEQVELETWTYDPRLLSRTQTVDPLSLYLSLEDRRDERLSMAADELLEGMDW